jgi:ubiquinone/menaquinone biosynthesis C-methylase UbiE
VEPNSEEEIIQIYRKRSKRYDFTSNLYDLIGFRSSHYRKQAVRELSLRQGDRVVEIGCGTGLNFALILQAIGPEGKLIGVDMTDAMLEWAKKRTKENGWTNVELIQCDAASFNFPKDTDAVISTFALTLSPAFDQVISNAAECLKKGRRMVVLDLKRPSGWLKHFFPLFLGLTKPFAISMDYATRRPWESFARHFLRTSLTNLYGGFAYIVVGEK